MTGRRRPMNMLKPCLKHLAALALCLVVTAAALALQPGTARANDGPIVPMSAMQRTTR